MADLKWDVKQDDYWKEVHTLTIGKFMLVINKLTDEDFDWIVNYLGDNDKILWHSLIEGVATSLPKAKKDMIEALAEIAKGFKALAKELK
jgi:hypothetical protein